MSALIVIGCQWGDEGKGKLVDYLTSKADNVVRFQGGNNAGHTIVVEGVTTKLNLIPSGILREDCKCLIGAGCVVDPEVICNEIDQLTSSGYTVDPTRLVLDRDADLLLSYHRLLDQAREVRRGDDKIGTTGKGIGPAYGDRVSRSGIRLAELFDLPNLRTKVESIIEETNLYLESVMKSDMRADIDEVWASIETAAEKLSPYIGNVSLLVDQAITSNKKVVFEGAQGTLLDLVHGTFPYVTSSNTVAGAVTTGVGIGPRQIDWVFGVAKAYTTRVGEGPFPTELDDQLGEFLREKGHEFGTVTGRPRRCGWFDAFALKRAVRINGVNSLAVTKLDVLSGVEKVKICINYMLDGKKLDDVPSLASELDSITPEYIELEGWEDDISEIKKWHNLPSQARMYLATISEILACPISMVSVGPDRDATIFSNTGSFVRNFCS